MSSWKPQRPDCEAAVNHRRYAPPLLTLVLTGLAASSLGYADTRASVSGNAGYKIMEPLAVSGTANIGFEPSGKGALWTATFKFSAKSLWYKMSYAMNNEFDEDGVVRSVIEKTAGGKDSSFVLQRIEGGVSLEVDAPNMHLTHYLKTDKPVHDLLSLSRLLVAKHEEGRLETLDGARFLLLAERCIAPVVLSVEGFLGGRFTVASRLEGDECLLGGDKPPSVEGKRALAAMILKKKATARMVTTFEMSFLRGRWAPREIRFKVSGRWVRLEQR